LKEVSADRFIIRQVTPGGAKCQLPARPIVNFLKRKRIILFTNSYPLSYNASKLRKVPNGMKMSKSSVENRRNILIIKPSAMGDIALALPALASLRASFADARISWLVRAEFAPLLRCAQGLDEIIIFDRKLLGRWYKSPAALKSLLEFLKTLRSRKFDLVLDLQGLFRSASLEALIASSGIPRA
jgi:hypothetical protein